MINNNYKVKSISIPISVFLTFLHLKIRFIRRDYWKGSYKIKH